MLGPRFSVVIAAYRARDTVVRAAESALSQTLPPHEVIVVDDASPDDQLDVLARYGDRIRLVRRGVNGGEAAAKNSGVHAATGDWVVLLDADDYWSPGRLAAMAALLAEQSELGIVTTDAWIERDDERLRRYYRGPTGARWADGDQRAEILQRNFVFPHPAVRREVWLAAGGMDESRRDCGADWPLWVRLIYTGQLAGLVDEPLAHYALTSGSLSDSATLLTRTRQAAMQACLDQPDASPQERLTAEQNLAASERSLRRIEALMDVWDGRRRRRRLLAIAADGAYRKRHRAEAALAAVSPALARRRMTMSPNEVVRG